MNRLNFSGHESFQCRELWLKKGFDFVKNGNSFNSPSAVVDLGVGKNMVSAIQYWMMVFNLLDSEKKLTDFAEYIFGENGKDPFLEDNGTLWLLHYQLIKRKHASIYSLFFNDFRKERPEFNRSHLVNYLVRRCEENGNTVSKNTIIKDVGVFLNTYLSPIKGDRDFKDLLSGLLIDLGLVERIDKTAPGGSTWFRVINTAKEDIPVEILFFCILSNEDYGDSISVYSLLSAEGSIGSAFAINSSGMIKKIEDLTQKYRGDVTYMDDAGIKEVQLKTKFDKWAAFFERNYDAAAKIIKTIGLLTIFASKSAKINRDFLLKYSRLSLGIENPGEIIRVLEDKKIIRFLKFKQCFILFEGTDLDIESATREAASHVDMPTDIVPILKERFQFPYILARAVFFKTGTPRFFEIVFSNQPLNDLPTGQVDGFINLIFNDELKLADIQEVSKNTGEAILYGLYQNSIEIGDIIWELEKLKYVLSRNNDDRVAQRELKEMLSHLGNELNRRILSSLYTNIGNVAWFFQGEKEAINTRKNFYRVLSRISEALYSKTPIYRNELINRHKLSSNIPLAKKNLIKQLVEKWEDRELGFSPDHYPPEKTIYLTLLKDTKIHREDEDGYMTLSAPREPSFMPLWHECENFLENTKKTRKSAADLIDILSKRPFKLKQGFLEFWAPVFLFIKRDSFALFSGDTYVPELTAEILFIITKEPEKYFIKAFDIEGIRLELFNKYRVLVKKEAEDRITNLSFVDTIKPFLTFYHGLPDYSKKTGKMSPTALALRAAIAKAKDPEKTFFVDFPRAFGYTIEQLTTSTKRLEEFIHRLRDGIYEIKNCSDQLIDRIESFLKEQLGLQTFDFPGYKKELQVRCKSLKRYLLLPHQKTFFNRLHSELDDRKAWLKSIVQSVLGKSIDMLEDEEEEIVYKELGHMFLELDNLCELSKIRIDKEKEEIFKLAVTTLTEGTKERVIRYPKSKAAQRDELKSALKEKLGMDKSTNIMVLFTLLKEQLDNE